jgi:hypothetical protein
MYVQGMYVRGRGRNLDLRSGCGAAEMHREIEMRWRLAGTGSGTYTTDGGKKSKY